MSPGVGAPSVVEVAADVYAFVQPDGSWGINNAGFVVGDEDVTVIDSCVTEARTRALRDAIRAVTRLPVATLANTHHHRDHTFGNHLFAPATIVGHRRCREEVLRQGLGPMHILPADDFGDIRIAPPTVVFDERLTLFAGAIRIEAIHLGPAHTSNDVVYWLPDQRVLFAGDLVFSEGTPYLAEGSLRGSAEALDRIDALDPAVIVPGHGEVCDRHAVSAVRGYLQAIGRIVEEAVAADRPALEATRRADLREYERWTCPERAVVAVHKGLSEAGSNPEEASAGLAKYLADMTELRGGEPPRCLA